MGSLRVVCEQATNGRNLMDGLLSHIVEHRLFEGMKRMTSYCMAKNFQGEVTASTFLQK